MSDQPNQVHLFVYEEYERGGGMNDYVDTFASPADAYRHMKENELNPPAQLAIDDGGKLRKYADLEIEVEPIGEGERDLVTSWNTDAGKILADRQRQRFQPPAHIRDQWGGEMGTVGMGFSGYWVNVEG
jgi:hypothetical protein